MSNYEVRDSKTKTVYMGFSYYSDCMLMISRETQNDKRRGEYKPYGYEIHDTTAKKSYVVTPQAIRKYEASEIRGANNPYNDFSGAFANLNRIAHDNIQLNED